MPDNAKDAEKTPIGDPPPPKKPIKAETPMEDPFTEQTTHPAGTGQGANKARRKDSGGNLEDAWSIGEGFSPIP
jgi:hypothetical protein